MINFKVITNPKTSVDAFNTDMQNVANILGLSYNSEKHCLYKEGNNIGIKFDFETNASYLYIYLFNLSTDTKVSIGTNESAAIGYFKYANFYFFYSKTENDNTVVGFDSSITNICLSFVFTKGKLKNIETNEESEKECICVTYPLSTQSGGFQSSSYLCTVFDDGTVYYSGNSLKNSLFFYVFTPYFFETETDLVFLEDIYSIVLFKTLASQSEEIILKEGIFTKMSSTGGYLIKRKES